MATAPPTLTALARKFKLQVNTGTTVAPTWTDVKGITEFKPPLTPSMEDDSSYDDEGWGSTTKTGLAWSIEAKILRKVGASDATTYDPGQEALRLAAELFGEEGVAEVRWYDRNGGPEAYQGFAEVEFILDGGNRTSLESASVKLHGKGARTTIANPLA